MLGAGLGSANIWSLCLGFLSVFYSAWGYSCGNSHGIVYIKFRESSEFKGSSELVLSC